MAGVTVTIESLGRLELRVNGKAINARPGKLPRPWQMFFLLALEKDRTLPDNDLISKLWEGWNPTAMGEEDLAAGTLAAKNNLKNVALRLRKELACLAGTDVNPVQRAGTGYRLSAEIAVEADLLAFQTLCDKARDWPNKSVDETLPLFYEILKVYRGDITWYAGGPKWLRDLALAAGAQFLETMTDCFAMLWKQGLYREILKVYRKVGQVRPPCDEMELYRYHAMNELRMYTGMTSSFYQTARAFEQRNMADSPVIKEIREIVRSAHIFLAEKERDMDVIHRDLSRAMQESGTGDRAAVCSYKELKWLCRQHPGRYAVAVFTFRLSEFEQDQGSLEEAMKRFEEIAARTLRGHDAIAPYSANQILVMMPNHSVTSGHQVKERLCFEFERSVGGKAIFLEGDVAELRPSIPAQKSGILKLQPAISNA